MPYDNATAKIVQRLAEHETKTVPVIERYSQLHGVVKVDGMGSFEEVFERTSSVLESLFKAGQAMLQSRMAIGSSHAHAKRAASFRPPEHSRARRTDATRIPPSALARAVSPARWDPTR
jgi:CBS-domain-containing membrane protein